MTDTASDLFDKIRQQFDTAPYPNTPINQSPKDSPPLLYIHNLVTSYYLRNQKVIDTKDKIILDAGCGSGYKSLVLAEANPGAKIIGIDLSSESVKLAKERLEYQGIENAEFYVLSLNDINQLNYKFHYINCDEMLYLFPDVSEALKSLKSVLEPDGIIRGNLHSAIQRFHIFCAQKAFKLMGLLDENPGDLEADIVRETLNNLKDSVYLKQRTWSSKEERYKSNLAIFMNFLFQGDKGYTISEMFSALRGADLEFISMVNWREWNIYDLFKEPDNLPAFLGMSLPEASVEEQLQLYELLNPRHRLLDFWCGHPDQGQPFLPVIDWSDSDWQNAKVYIHPQLNISEFRQDLITSVAESKIFTLDKQVKSLDLDSSKASCLIPLLERPQPFTSLVAYWQQIRPINPTTLEPTTPEQAFAVVKQLFAMLESFGYVMLENLS